jgi:hypothetical protein
MYCHSLLHGKFVQLYDIHDLKLSHEVLRKQSDSYLINSIKLF